MSLLRQHRLGNQVGVSPEAWEKVKATISITAELKLEGMGNTFVVSQMVSRDFGLDPNEYGQNVPHIHRIGGDMFVKYESLVQKVANRLGQEEVVDSVYTYIEDEIINFVIKTTVHDPDINLYLSDIYWEIYDEQPERFEFKPIPREYFGNFKLPDESELILGR